jgi:beta-glucosidase
MSSYNTVNGTTVTENDLLETPLNSEWGFDGVVVSDWTAVRSLASANASQDLVMPGPDGPWGAALVAAVRAGDIEESAVDRKVLRLLRLAQRVGALKGFEVQEPVLVEDGVAFVREAAAEGTVLLANDGVLPLDASSLPKVAVIGQNARLARTQGGGSATVVPERVVSPLEALRAALPDAQVTYAAGAVVEEGMAELERATITNPATGGPGALVRFLGADGNELHREDRLATTLFYFGGDAPITSTALYEVSLTWTPDFSGAVQLGFAAVGHGRVFVDGELRTEETAVAVGMDLGAALLSPPAVTTSVEVTAGTPVDLRIEFDMRSREGLAGLEGIFGIIVGTKPDQSDPDGLIEEAVRAAADADLAVVVVGTSSQVESEGFDRTSLALPGRQDDLVAAVAATGTPTVVVVNSGSPVLLPWRNDVAAVLLTYFGGQEMGNALVDVLTGAVEPGGRLPTTWPVAEGDVPVLSTTPVDGVLEYTEGIHIGYRAWLRQQAGAGASPAYWFGHGLGYTDIPLLTADVPATATAGEVVTVRVEVENRGDRDGKQVVQVYAERGDSAVERPARWLVGFAPVQVPAGVRATVDVAVPTRNLAHWDAGWQYEPGEHTLRIGTSAVELPLTATLTVEEADR